MLTLAGHRSYLPFLSIVLSGAFVMGVKWSRWRILPLIVIAVLIACEATLRLAWRQDVVIEGPSKPYLPNGHYRYHLPQRTVDFQFNAEGFRDSAVHPVPKPAGIYRILIVGDSFTLGTDNQYDEIWPVLLERHMAEKKFPADIIKAGVGEYDTRDELLMMQKLVPKYHPDLVLMAFLPNDIFTNEPLDASARSAGDRPVAESMPSVPQFQTISFFRNLLLRNDYIYCGVYWVTSRRQFFTYNQTALAARQYQVTRELLTQANRYARSEGSRFVALSIPQHFQVLAKARGFRLPGLAEDIVDRKMSELAGRQGFPWLSSLETLADHYRAHRLDLYYREDGHFTPLGNQVFSGWLIGALRPLMPGI